MILQHAIRHAQERTTPYKDSLTPKQRVVFNKISAIPANYVGLIKFDGDMWAYVTEDSFYLDVLGEWWLVTDQYTAARSIAP